MTTHARPPKTTKKTATKKTATKKAATKKTTAAKKTAAKKAAAKKTVAPPRTRATSPHSAEQQYTYPGVLRRRPAATEAQLTRIEARLKRPLPADYRAFLTTHNGGSPSRCMFEADGETFRLECFHGVGEPRRSDAYNVETVSAGVREVLGHEVLAIAGDGSGDQLIYDPTRGPGLWWWRHDDDDDGPAVAPSFTALNAMLREAPDDDG